MSAGRWFATVVVLAAVGGLLWWWPDPSPVREVDVPRPAVPVVVGATGGSWFCAARDTGVEGFAHTVFITSLSEEDLEVRAEAFGDEGSVGTTTIPVAAGSSTALDVATIGGPAASVMLETSGPAVVEHRLSHPKGADQAPCATLSSDEWHFPVVATTRDATARLTVFNPFASDAAVDVEVAFDTGVVRVPTALSGIVVPAGTSKVVELGDAVQRRGQFSATVQTRSGRVVAELAQSFDDADSSLPVSGVRLEGGSRAAAERWSFAGGFTDPSASEQLVVLNPDDSTAEVLVQVIPFGGVDAMPEPFTLKVPARRYGLIDLTKESRIAQVGYHAIEVEALDGAEVVAARVLDVSASVEVPEMPLRVQMERGTSGSIGSVAAAPRWVAGGFTSEPGAVALMIHNPGTGIAVAEVSSPGSDTDPVRLEVPPGDSQVVTGDTLAPTESTWSAEVTTEGAAVVVEQVQVFATETDFTWQPAVPVVARISELERLG
jgi:hypothetical protein